MMIAAVNAPITAVLAPIGIPIFHGVSEWQHDEWRSGVTRQKLPNFYTL